MSSVNGVILSKRASELRQSEGSFPVAPPSFPVDPLLLSTVHELPSSSSTIRRPRAGTLPSTFHIGTSAAGPPRHLNSNFSVAPGTNSTSSLPASGSSTPGGNHGLDYPFSTTSTSSNSSSNNGSANSLLPPHSSNNSISNNTSAASRLRSGSLGLPSSSLSNAFGPTVWSGGWGNSSTTPNGTLVGNDARSPESSTYGDDSHLRTLDYLGIDNDNNSNSGSGIFGDVNGGADGIRKVSNPNPIMHNSSSYTNLRSLSLSEIQQGRMRSNTVATFSCRSTDFSSSSNRLSFPPSTSSALDSLSNNNNNPEYFGDLPSSSSSFHRSTSSTDSSRLLYSSAVGGSTSNNNLDESELIQPNNLNNNRARAATTIGILDESREVYLRRRAGTTATGAGGIIQNSGIAAGGDGYEGGSTSLLERRLRGMSIGQDESPSWNATPRSITPDQPGQQLNSSSSPSPQSQLPTRSLWIGNLDPATTTAELLAVFSPYGPIENLRLIPDKECGFVNFFNANDAMHAKEDVLSRLGGTSMNSSTSNSTVRIGYGKPDSSSSSSPSNNFNNNNNNPGLIRSMSGGNYSPDFNNQNGGGMIGMGMMSSSAPTRALWIGSIPNTTTPAHLMMLFSPFGQIESARVLTHKSCGFINFERVEDAVSARNALSGREILGAEIGTIRIGFAKVPNKSINPAFNPEPNNLPPGTMYNPMINSMNRNFIPSPMVGVNGAGIYRGPPLNVPMLVQGGAPFIPGMMGTTGSGGMDMMGNNGLPFDATVLPAENLEPLISTILGSEEEIKEAMVELGGEEFSPEETTGLAPRTDLLYYDTFPASAYNDPALARRYANADAPRLRDLRKQLDGLLTTEEIDQIAVELADECVALASDYIGNTLIQKIFERASPQGRMIMLVKIAPHLAQIGIHKNGTWAVQKIIQTVQTPEEHDIVTKSLQPFTPALLLNDFGNYVVQGALRFGSPLTDFIFDAMVDRCWEIGSGRFGARSTRQTLESPLASRYQIKRVAVAILLNSVPLATSQNGALLITWLLDTSNLPGRYRALATRYEPNLATLCTHKLASLAVLKIINQRVDLKASRMILDQLSAGEDSKLIDEILADQVHGTTFITKVLNSAFVDLKERGIITERIRAAIGILQAQTIPAYRTLVESVGLPYQGIIVSPLPVPLPSYNSGPYQNNSGQNQYQNQGPPQWQQQQQFNPYPPPQFGGGGNNYPSYPNNPQFSQPPNNYPSFFPGQPFYGGGGGSQQNNFQQQRGPPLSNNNGFNPQMQSQQAGNFMQRPPLDPINNNGAGGAGNFFSGLSATPFSGAPAVQEGDRLKDFPTLSPSVNGAAPSS